MAATGFIGIGTMGGDARAKPAVPPRLHWHVPITYDFRQS